MRYNENNCSVELSVAELCSYTLSSGDLGAYRVTFNSDGVSAELLKKLQKDASGYYDPDVVLTNTSLLEGIHFSVSSRADGIIRGADGFLCLDTVRLVRGYEMKLPPRAEYVAYMKCMAHLLCSRDRCDSLRCRLTYYNVDTGKLKYFDYRFHASDLRSFYSELLLRILWRARLEISRASEVLPSAAGVSFPYSELREGQEIMIRRSYSAIKHGRRIFVEAPTGTGKTVSALYPSVRALGEGHIDKIFYLTAKASTRREAYVAAGKLFEGGARLRTVVISAKEQVCPMRSVHALTGAEPCDPATCPFASGYYDRVEGALRELVSEYNGYPRSIIRKTAEKHSVCPYELSLDLSELCDIIICDYNYAFDPCVYFRRYFSDLGRSERYAFLIDEAHNLADRARDMYSSALRRSEIIAIRDAVSPVSEELRSSADRLILGVNKLRSLCKGDVTKDAEGNDMGFYMSHSPLGAFQKELEVFKTSLDAWMKKNRDHPIMGELERLLSPVRRYIAVSEYFDKGFLCYVELLGGDITVKLYCLDPSPTMDVLLRRAQSAVLFSATLTPTEYFCDVLGGTRNTERVVLPSPFDPERLSVTVLDGLSVRSEDRNKNYAKFATAIAATVSPKHGNYIAYFPSYECLEGVLKIFEKKYPNVETVVQSRGMGASEKERFLSAFKDDEGHLRIGFCVLGGAFSEGVDLPGSRLIGSIIFGVGIPALSNERNIIKEYFDNTTGSGYDYAYTYPGMTHVLQAAGRVIRREGDRGVVVLVDDRYAEPKYRGLFPKHWQGVQYTGNARSLAEIVRRFWEKWGIC